MNSLRFESVYWISVAYSYVMWGSIMQSAKDEDRTEKRNVMYSLSLLESGHPSSPDFADQYLGYSGTRLCISHR